MLLLLLLLYHLDWVEQVKGYFLIIAIPSVMLTIAAGTITVEVSAATIRGIVIVVTTTVLTIVTAIKLFVKM